MVHRWHGIYWLIYIYIIYYIYVHSLQPTSSIQSYHKLQTPPPAGNFKLLIDPPSTATNPLTKLPRPFYYSKMQVSQPCKSLYHNPTTTSHPSSKTRKPQTNLKTHKPSVIQTLIIKTQLLPPWTRSVLAPLTTILDLLDLTEIAQNILTPQNVNQNNYLHYRMLTKITQNNPFITQNVNCLKKSNQ